jgi:manganese/zinc/iron transport system permease protein
MLLGASIMGIFTTAIIEFFSKKIKLQTDASIGITFTFLFALGVILITAFLGQVDLDQECILYGEIAFVPLDTFIREGVSYGPKSVWLLGVNFLLILLVVTKGFKAFQLISFNNSFAQSIGLNTTKWHYILMGLTSVTTVFSFEQVGAILVVAFLIIPPATAYLLSKQLKQVLYLAALFGCSSSILGYFFAMHFNASVSGSMGVIAGCQFLLVFFYIVLQKSFGAKTSQQTIKKV